MIKISQKELMRLAENHEPSASESAPSYRKATCVICGKPMVEMWHLWLKYVDSKKQKWVKEIHLCKDCGKKYE